jgi:hypothetical protein
MLVNIIYMYIKLLDYQLNQANLDFAITTESILDR